MRPNPHDPPFPNTCARTPAHHPSPAGNGFCQVWGTQPSSIDKAEDRDLWMELLYKLDIKQPSGACWSARVGGGWRGVRLSSLVGGTCV